MFEELFVRRKLDAKKAIAFGFVEKGDAYLYETDILDHAFRLKVALFSPDGMDIRVDTTLIEKETDTEYVLYKTKAVGTFVGGVRQAIEDVLMQAAKNCCDREVFHARQTKEILRHVFETYGDEPEFLWDKFPDNAVWRRKDTGKWYGAVLTVTKNKLGLDSEEKAEIVDLRISPEQMAELLQKEHYYPGWHMNKKHWYTILLDGSVATEKICEHIAESYRLAR